MAPARGPAYLSGRKKGTFRGQFLNRPEQVKPAKEGPLGS